VEIAIITGPTYEIASRRIEQANLAKDGVELRLDLFQEINIPIIKELREKIRGKTIFTLRSRRNGGGFAGSEDKRILLLNELLSLNPEYFDFEFDTDLSTLQISEQTKIILSYHNFISTPKHLEIVLKKMFHPSAYAYKLCTTANSLSDSYMMLRFIQKMHKEGVNIIGLCMGDYGKITRTDGIKSGNYLNYSILNIRDKVAPGLTIA